MFEEIGIPWFVWILSFLTMLIVYLWRSGYSLNPFSYIENYIENKRLEEAFCLGLTWEEYKKKHNIHTKT